MSKRRGLLEAVIAGLCALLGGAASAGSNERDSAAELLNWKERYKAVVTHCLDRDFTQTSCDYHNASRLDHGLLFTVTDAVADKANRAVHGMHSAFEYLKSGMLNSKSELGRRVLDDFDELKGMAARKVEREKLKDCHRACLATCMSSHLISYVDGWQRSARGAVEAGRGVCREFSRISEDIMKGLGLKSWVVGGRLYRIDSNTKKKVPWDYHAMVGVKIDGKPYIMEPQNDACTFYKYDFDKDRENEGGGYKLQPEGEDTHASF